jgi:hypothetical protein
MVDRGRTSTMGRRDPDGWKRRVKPEPRRRWFLKMAPTAIVALSNLGGAIGFIERLFARRPAPAPVVITPAPGALRLVAQPGQYRLTFGAVGKADGFATVTGEGAAISHPDSTLTIPLTSDV